MSEQPAGQSTLQRGIPRRAALIGLGLTGLAAVSGGAWLALTRWAQMPAAPNSTATASKPAIAPLLVYRGHNMIISGVAWSPDGTRIASIGGTSMHIWDAASGQRLELYRDIAGWVGAVAWSPDSMSAGSPASSRVASGGEGQKVLVWDATSGKVLAVYGGI